jgi:predicted extracellular nuclease
MPLFGRYQPPNLLSAAQRLQQTEVIKGFISNFLALDVQANILILGDLNDFQFSTAVKTLAGDHLKNLVLTLPDNQQYSYVFDGNSQMLDQMLASHSLAEKLSYFGVVHVNAEFAANDRLSDHDPVLARFLVNPR